MVGTYVLNLMDKAAISEASVFGILTADVCIRPSFLMFNVLM
jgi:hypothetical protein